jgi:hypothetical protein
MSLRINRMINALTDEEIRGVLALYREKGGYTFAGHPPEEDLRYMVGVVSLEGYDPEHWLRTLIAEVQRTGSTSED